MEENQTTPLKLVETELAKPDIAALIKADEEARVSACSAEIQAALERHKCRIEFVQLFVNGQSEAPRMRIVAIARQ